MKDSIHKDLIEFPERYFDFYKIEEDQKLNVASLYLDGEALKLYQWLFRNNQLIDWPHFADKSTEGRFANLGQLPYVIEYQNCCEDSFGESDVLFPGRTYVHPQWSNITNSLLLQHHSEQLECKSNTNARKVLDESYDMHKDANSCSKSSKSIELFIPLNDMNDEEEIFTIRNELIESVIANAYKPTFWNNSIVSIPCDLSIFDIRKALDDHWNQLFARHFRKFYPFRLVQHWEEMHSIPSTFSYAKLMSKVTNGGRDYVGCFIMRPKFAECDGYDLKCLGSQSNLVEKSIILHGWDPEFFLDDGGIDKWTVQHWNSQKVDHQQLFEIFGQEHEPILPEWTTERCGKCRWVEDLDGNSKIKCNMCHIVVHQEFHGLDVAYHNVDTKERALWILSIPCNSCLKVCMICEHLQGSDNLCSKCTTNFCVLRALQAGYHMVLIEFDSWSNHISRYLSALTQTNMGEILSLRYFHPIVIFSNVGVDENVIDTALVKWLLLYFLPRIDQEDKDDIILVKATLNTHPSLNKFA
ncbi:hypothetical protein H5410_020876, partial [Solanum commersonii]